MAIFFLTIYSWIFGNYNTYHWFTYSSLRSSGGKGGTAHSLPLHLQDVARKTPKIWFNANSLLQTVSPVEKHDTTPNYPGRCRGRTGSSVGRYTIQKHTPILTWCIWSEVASCSSRGSTAWRSHSSSCRMLPGAVEAGERRGARRCTGGGAPEVRGRGGGWVPAVRGRRGAPAPEARGCRGAPAPEARGAQDWLLLSLCYSHKHNTCLEHITISWNHL